MHRVTGGWHLVGEVALDEADLSGSLARLRSAAEGLEPDGISTKLLIPNDQIKYLALDTTRAEVDDVREALHGATPYSVDELVYDFTKGGGRTYVAAVAKDTLNEAQQFATEHGFNPNSFAAVPEPFTYVGEAFFGPVDGQAVERDADSVVIIGDADVSIPEPVAEPALELEEVPETVAEEAPVDVSEPEVDAPAEDVVADEEIATEVVPDVEVAEKTPVEEAPEDVAEPELVPEIAPENEDVVVSEPSTDEPAAEAAVEDVVVEEDATVEDEQVEEAPAPMFASRLRADRTDGHPAPAPETEVTPETGRTEPTFSRQTPASLAVPTGKGTDPMPPLSAPNRGVDAAPVVQPITTEAPDVQAPAAEIAITGEAPTALSPDAAVTAKPLTAQHDDDVSAPSVETTDEPSDEKRGAAATAIGAATAVGGAVGGMFASRRMARAEAKAADAAKEAETDAKPDEKSRLTVFGARKQPKKKPKVVVGGKPRFLLPILTAVLLLFLLAFAAFAAMSEEGFAYWFGFGSAEETQIAADPADPTSAPEVAEAQAEDATEVAALDSSDALAAPTAPAGGQVLTPEEAARIYAATGVWQRAPRIPLNPRTTSLDQLALATAPSPVVRVPPSPLASASSVAGDAVIATPIDPPPPSQQFDYNEEGLVVATEQGAVTPDGILVIAGRPALNPPTRPGTVAPEITPQDQLAAVIPEEAAPIENAPEGVIVIAGRPSIEPPVRTGTAVPAPAPAPEAAALAAGDAPLVATDDLLVLAGSPTILPPVRPGALAPTAAPTPEVAPELPADVTPEVETPTTDTAVDGVNLIAGPPPILPPARPGTIAPQADIDSLTQDIAVALSTSTAQTPDTDTRRPTQRPASIQQVAVAAAEAAAAANTPVVGALTIEQAAGFRPRTRPAGLAPVPTPDPEPEPEVAAVEPAPAGLQIAPEIAAAVQAAANRPNPIVNPTAQAVPQSSRPDTRPRNMDRIVARAAQAQERAATQVAAVAPRTVAPSGPTAGSVAQAATLDNAINLRDVNLIGIYGGSGDRRALVRMGNGRYLRVTVGDRLDGGRVTAISASALSYSKRGRAITLEVPG
ncbi:hypothetical protein SAMN05444287_0706 [Octadecabacter temperatus]|uniref:Type IV pilus biogenesis n=2 Tax=Octadecabacter temperatus TaxID=1458307 RepID=A0A0K0Y3V8_9RHOB|nr:Type IV pilus biogenesis [Octadecabacter temperatus]SIN96782.1 hypothetical protein SAMN05444287_0706 [Octadecabacter temperatus]